MIDMQQLTTAIPISPFHAEAKLYLVANLDIMGQTRNLLKIKDLPNIQKEGELAQFDKKIENTIGRVHNLRKDIEGYYSHFTGFPESDTELTEDSRILYRKLRIPHLKFQYVSDSLIVFTPIYENMDYLVMQETCSLLMACCSSILHCFARETPIRGAIDIGIGVEMEEGDLYGPIIAKTHLLLSVNGGLIFPTFGGLKFLTFI